MVIISAKRHTHSVQAVAFLFLVATGCGRTALNVAGLGGIPEAGVGLEESCLLAGYRGPEVVRLVQAA